MKKRVPIAILLAALTAVMLAGSGMAGGGGPGPATLPASQSPYYLGLVQTMSGLTGPGEQLSMARDPVTGRIFVAYYDPDLESLRVAAKAKAGQGNCGDGLNWYCATVDTPAANHRTGLSPSIAIYHGEYGLRVGIAYIDRVDNPSGSSLKYADFFASPSMLYSTNPAQWNWDVAVVDNQQDSRPSLKMDNLGAPHIAFEQVQSGVKRIRYASPPEGSSGIGCTNSDSEHPDWYCESIISGNAGHLPSLGIGADDIPRIAYYYTGSGSYIAFAIKDITAPGFTCGDGGKWRCSYIANAVVSNLALKVYTVGGGSFSHIAYIDSTDDRLKYALYVSSASAFANCGFNPQQDWMCETVADVGPASIGLSIEVDRTGEPLIAYELSDAMGPSALYLAQSIPGPAENCLSSTSGDMAWVCDPIAVPANGENWVGFSTSLAVDNYGLGTIAYFADDEFYSTTSVHLAAQKAHIFLPLVHR